jgi:hypothetical protein
MDHSQNGPLTADELNRLPFEQIAQRLTQSLDVGPQQDVSLDQLLELEVPNEYFASSHGLDFTLAHGSDFSLGPQAQVSLSNSPYQPESYHVTVAGNNHLLLPSEIPPNWFLEQEVQAPPIDSPYHQEEHHLTVEPLSSQLGNNERPPITPPDFFFLPEVQTSFNNTPYQQEEHHQTMDQSSVDSMTPQNVVQARTQRPANAESRSQSSHSGGDASPGSDAVSAPHPTAAVSTPEADGLQFASYADAFAKVDPMFRDRTKVKAADDDIEEVEQNAAHYVKLLVDALSCADYMDAEKFRTTMTGVKKPSTAADVQGWADWQDDTLDVVDGHFTMPNVEARVEWIAWAIYEEILKVHRVGFRFTTLTADRKSKCSQRVVLAARAIRSTAITRQRILEGCDLSDLAAGPTAYASSTARNRRNNKGRSDKAQANGAGNVGAGNATAAAQGRGRTSRSAKTSGAIAQRYMSRGTMALQKKQEKRNGGQGGDQGGDQDGNQNEDGDEGGDEGGDENEDDDDDEGEPGTFTADVQQFQQSARPSTSRPSTQHPRTFPSQRMQPGAQNTSNVSRLSTGFGGNFNMAAQSMPRNYGTYGQPGQSQDLGFSLAQSLNTNRVGYPLLGGANYGANNGVSPGSFPPQSRIGGLSGAYQPPLNTTLQRRRTTDETGSPTPAESSQASDGMPEENGNKRRRT